MINIDSKAIKLQIWDTVQILIFILIILVLIYQKKKRLAKSLSVLLQDHTTEELLELYWFMISHGNFLKKNCFFFFHLFIFYFCR